ncbi:hypothetical protein N0V82_007860 [Gnomoniopsis sp. IMI 355080]|nr:hypothetical protein N0V82_007860 [Gnomoniopsis sp. IMI 355080]
MPCLPPRPEAEDQEKYHQKVSDFRLKRELSSKLDNTVYGFLIPFVGLPIQESDWKVYNILRANDNRFLLKYAISIEKRTFLVINAELEDDDSGTRYTRMRLREMILDSWIVEGGRPETFRYLGIWRITNESITEHLIHAYINHYGSLDKGDQIVLKPNEGTGFGDNAFLKCGNSLARELRRLSTGNIEMKKAYYLKLGKDEDDLIFYTVMQFGEKGEEEEEGDKVTESDVKSASDSDDGDDEVIFRGRAKSRNF